MASIIIQKTHFRLKFALFDSKLEYLQIRHRVALFKILPYFTENLENLSLSY